ncbi:MAG: MBOAT family protein [Lachnospiraceae bacterium]|nr:MBOAT family protein [Lachnospiraceae bacterium]
MSYNSFNCIFFFLPLSAVLYYLAGWKSRRLAQLVLLGLSLWFYACASLRGLILLLTDMAVTYALSRVCAGGEAAGPGNADAVLSGTGKADAGTAPSAGPVQTTDAGRSSVRCQNHGRAVFVLSVAMQIALLLYFKYTNFFLSNIAAAAGHSYTPLQIILPLGISFYTFSQIAFLVENRRGTLGRVTPLEYALYVTFFPKISEGPIMLPEDFFPQIRDKASIRFHAERFVCGMQFFACGLFKKVCLADFFSEAVSVGFENYRNGTTGDVIITMLAYTLQIYFDFSGYCDMAQGAAELLGFHLPINFDSPYRAVSVTDFWRRWHITLTGFFRRYVYFPLGGSRRGKIRTYVNIMIVFLVSGFWHGANWTFILWGVLHGLMQVMERALKGPLSHVPDVLRGIVTFAFVSVAWLLFRADSVGQWIFMVQRFPDLNFAINPALAETLRIPGLRAVLGALHVPYTDQEIFLLSAVILLGAGVAVCLWPVNSQRMKQEASWKSLLFTLALFMISVISMGKVSAFIYNNF